MKRYLIVGINVVTVQELEEMADSILELIPEATVQIGGGL